MLSIRQTNRCIATGVKGPPEAKHFADETLAFRVAWR
jgi:hypothetical protein